MGGGWAADQRQRLDDLLSPLPNDVFVFGGVEAPVGPVKGEAICLFGISGKFPQAYIGGLGAAGPKGATMGAEWTRSDGWGTIGLFDPGPFYGGYVSRHGSGFFFHLPTPIFVGIGTGW